MTPTTETTLHLEICVVRRKLISLFAKTIVFNVTDQRHFTVCGQANRPKIVGGPEAFEHEFPWVVCIHGMQIAPTITK